MFPNRRIREVLSAASLELSSQGTWPVRLRALLSNLGIRLQFETAKGRSGKAYLVFDDPPTIIVIRPAQLASNREHAHRSQRFSVAHELGHWIIWRRLGSMPDHLNYWNHEVLCNEFAAKLLLPPPLLQKHLVYLKDQLHVDPIDFPTRISKFAEVSWDVAARSISALAPNDFAYIRLIMATSTAHSSAPVLRAACSSFSNELGSFVGQGAVIRDFDAFRCLRRVEPSETSQLSLSMAVGRLQLDQVPCSVRRETLRSWVFVFRPSSAGVTVSKDKGPYRNGKTQRVEGRSQARGR